MIGNVYRKEKDCNSSEVGYIINEKYRRRGYAREAHLRKNIYFHKDENGDPIWKDTYIYAIVK